MPLLPNYLFVNTCSEQFDRIANTSGVAYILGYNGLPTPVPGEEVNSLRVLVHSGVEISPYPYLKEGDRVFIREGPFKGVVGVLLRTDLRSSKLVVSVHLMNRSVAVAVPTSCVEKFL
jgi:transcription antitermination factor NusG